MISLRFAGAAESWVGTAVTLGGSWVATRANAGGVSWYRDDDGGSIDAATGEYVHVRGWQIVSIELFYSDAS